MNKYRNYGLWIAVASLVLMILQDAGVQITPEKYNMYVDTLLNILVLMGIISSPSIGKGFRDKEGKQ